jgi:hypothetical protein
LSKSDPWKYESVSTLREIMSRETSTSKKKHQKQREISTDDTELHVQTIKITKKKKKKSLCNYLKMDN